MADINLTHLENKIGESKFSFLQPSIRVFLFKAFPIFDLDTSSSQNSINTKNLSDYVDEWQNINKNINLISSINPEEFKNMAYNEFINFINASKMTISSKSTYYFREDTILTFTDLYFFKKEDIGAIDNAFNNIINRLSIEILDKPNIKIPVKTDELRNSSFFYLPIIEVLRDELRNHQIDDSSWANFVTGLLKTTPPSENYSGYAEFTRFISYLSMYLRALQAIKSRDKNVKELENLKNKIKKESGFQKIDKYYLTLNENQVLKLDITPFFINANISYSMQTMYITSSILLLDCEIDDNMLKSLQRSIKGFSSSPHEFFLKTSREIYNYLINENDLMSTLFNKLHLADLIQPNDFIVIYARNSKISLTDQAKLKGIELNKDNLSNFTILEELGYRKVFGGFVTKSDFNIAAGDKPQIRLTCKSPLYLLDETLRLFVPGLFTSAFYDTLEVGDDKNFYTVLNNILTSYTIRDIVFILLKSCLGLKFPGESVVEKPNPNQQKQFVFPDSISRVLYDFRNYDHELPTHPLAVPIFLLHIAYKEMYRKELQEEGEFLSTFPLRLKIFKEKNSLKGYFKQLQNNFSKYTPTMKTPASIIKEIREVAFFELFEDTEQGIVFRPISYDVGVGESSNTRYINNQYLISFNKTQTLENVYSRVTSTFYIDILQEVLPFLKYPYTDGKLLAKYGFKDFGDLTNPNIQFNKKNIKYAEKYQEYSKIYLNYHNFSLQTGRIVKIFDSDSSPIVLGSVVDFYIFSFPSTLRGYVTSKEINLSVGGTLTETFSLSFLRSSSIDLPNIYEFLMSFKEE
jgi:hypothetical protein